MGTQAGAAVVLLCTLALYGCATTPEFDPAYAVASWYDFESGTSLTLATRGFGDYEERQRRGRLDPSVKLVDAETMGVMIRVFEQYGFFRRAIAGSPDSSSLRSSSTQVLAFDDGGRSLVMPFQPQPGVRGEKQWVEDFVDMKNGLVEIYRNTFSLTVTPERPDWR